MASTTLRSENMANNPCFKFANVVMIALLLSACEYISGGNSKFLDYRDYQDSLEFSIKALTVTRVGESFLLSPLYQKQSGKPINTLPTFSWTSSNESVASVSASGRVTTHREGTATITVSYQDAQDSYEITVDNGGDQLSGKLSYADKLYNETSGLEETEVFKPIRHATVELLDPSGTRFLMSTSTDNTGEFNLGYVIPTDFVIRVLSKTADDYALNYWINDLNGSVFGYAFRDLTYTGTALNLAPINQPDVAAAFNVLDVILTGAEYLQTKLGLVDSEPLIVYWEPENQVGTWYCESDYFGEICPRGNGIYLYNDYLAKYNASADTDEYDDDIILHEYFHHIMANHFHSDSPGGCHKSTDNTQDMRLAWNEGVASYFSVAVKAWLNEVNPDRLSHKNNLSYIVDARNPEAPRVIDLLLTAPPEDDPYFYSTNEIAVAYVLNQIRERFHAGDEMILQVLSQWVNSHSHGVGHDDHTHDHGFESSANLELFWVNFLENFSDPFIENTLTDIFASRRIDYHEDGYESASELPLNLDTFTAAELGDGLELTLYRDDFSDDVDQFLLSVSAGISYTIETLELSNGADTLIEVFDQTSSEAVIVASNDNSLGDDHYIRPPQEQAAAGSCHSIARPINDSSSLASRIVVTPSANASYLVVVKSAHKHQSAGKFGSYTLKVSEK